MPARNNVAQNAPAVKLFDYTAKSGNAFRAVLLEDVLKMAGVTVPDMSKVLAFRAEGLGLIVTLERIGESVKLTPPKSLTMNTPTKRDRNGVSWLLRTSGLYYHVTGAKDWIRFEGAPDNAPAAADDVPPLPA